MSGLASGHELLKCWLRARNKSFAGLGQADTACCADEERYSDAGLERAYHLTDSRWGHAKFGGGSPKTAVLGNAKERLHAIERTLPNCEVPLHDPSTLSRIVARGKWPYI